LIGELPLSERDAIVLDMEASIEHLSRGTIRNADTLLIVVEPYYRALETAGRIAKLAAELRIPTVMAVANKVRTEPDAQAVRDYCRLHAIELAALIPFDDRIGAVDRLGGSVLDQAPDSAALREIASLVDRLSRAHAA
jgi:CO dehydrogenase maturation factor